MPEKKHLSRLLSHEITEEDFKVAYKTAETRIQQVGDQSEVSAAKKLQILQQLSEFDLGRFLIQNKGLNGYWTHYILTHPWFGAKSGINNQGQTFSPLEAYLLNRSPTLLATQQRFEIFLNQIQLSVKNNAVLACIPCGMMGELLYLDFSGIDRIDLVGIDYDENTFIDAKALAEEKHLTHCVKLCQSDAWHLSALKEFDLISSNGLNIYEPDDAKVTALYGQFHQALKPGGRLVTSILTPPQEWIQSNINQEDLAFQKLIFADVLGVKWQCFRTADLTCAQLTQAGFKQIEFIDDQARMFPTVVAVA